MCSKFVYDCYMPHFKLFSHWGTLMSFVQIYMDASNTKIWNTITDADNFFNSIFNQPLAQYRITLLITLLGDVDFSAPELCLAQVLDSELLEARAVGDLLLSRRHLILLATGTRVRSCATNEAVSNRLFRHHISRVLLTLESLEWLYPESLQVTGSKWNTIKLTQSHFEWLWLQMKHD